MFLDHYLNVPTLKSKWINARNSFWKERRSLKGENRISLSLIQKKNYCPVESMHFFYKTKPHVVIRKSFNNKFFLGLLVSY